MCRDEGEWVEIWVFSLLKEILEVLEWIRMSEYLLGGAVWEIWMDIEVLKQETEKSNTEMAERQC